MKRIVFVLLLGALVLTPLLRAQDPPTPTFRAGTTLIEFTIVARDGQGNPITDLTKDDIVVTENGQPRAVEFFRFDGAPPQPSPNALPPGHFTNRFETSPNAARHITAILVDAMNMPTVKDTYQFTQATTRIQILTYLDGLPPHTRVGLFRLGREVIDVLHDFTDDVAALRAQVAKMDLVMPELFGISGYRDPEYAASGASGSAEMKAGLAAALAADAKATGVLQRERADQAGRPDAAGARGARQSSRALSRPQEHRLGWQRDAAIHRGIAGAQVARL